MPSAPFHLIRFFARASESYRSDTPSVACTRPQSAMQFSMNPSALLLATFLLSVAGLFAFIWSLRKGLFEQQSSGARVIFAPEEIGRFDDPANNVARLTAHDAAQQAELNDRAQADRETAVPAFVLFTFAVVWLLVASAAGLLSSIKLHAPDLLVSQAWLTFGRL